MLTSGWHWILLRCAQFDFRAFQIIHIRNLCYASQCEATSCWWWRTMKMWTLQLQSKTGTRCNQIVGCCYVLSFGWILLQMKERQKIKKTNHIHKWINIGWCWKYPCEKWNFSNSIEHNKPVDTMWIWIINGKYIWIYGAHMYFVWLVEAISLWHSR